MKKLLPCLTLSLALSAAYAQDTDPQTQLEKQYDAELKSTNIDAYVKHLSARPHHVGSPYDKENAEYMLQLFKSWGYDAKIETFDVLFPSPKVRVLEMVSPTSYSAKLAEPALKEDATSGQTEEQLPTYNCYSADGDVTGELVFVNYGIPDDYDVLESLGIDVKGKIVIAKYGGSWRGIKPKVAQEHGAIGCLIYSDPEDDGYTQGDVYPTGAFKPEDGVQRGSVLDMPLYPGDPLTPGYGATKKANRLKQSEAKSLLKIPVLPISYGDALPLLAAMAGEVVPAQWRGTLPITYHTGPGPAKVHLKLAFNWDIKTLYNVIATMKGSTYPEEWVIRGNHHDAWVNGASDPVSGMAALMEEARSVGLLAKNGTKPARTIIYCAWDGEEPGLLGSTEWAETHAAELQQHAVAYINTDGNSRGFLGAEGSHTLESLVNDVAKSVTDPETQVSVFERRKALRAVNAGSAEEKKTQMQSSHMEIGALGSGSDYTPFIQHLGIPSINLGFGGEGRGGEYHSIYDSYDHYTRFKDPGFVYGVALSQTAGRLTLRLAFADVLPFDFMPFYTTVEGYAKDLMAQTDALRATTVVENDMIEKGLFKLAADPTKPFFPPKTEAQVPYLNFEKLQNALVMLKTAVTAYQTAAGKKPSDIPAVNKGLYQAEQELLLADGLPRRPWFKHAIYAPGFYTGYGVKTLPGVREAIEQRNWDEAQAEMVLLANALEKYAAHISRITALYQ